MLLADVLSLPSYLDTVSQFYRSFSDVIDVYTTVGPIWTIYRELAETLSIPDVYDSIWSVIWQYIDTFSLVDYAYWISTWARLPVEPLAIGEYLYNSYRFITELLLNVEDFSTYEAQFYRMRLETLTMTSALDYVGTFLREQVIQISLVDDLDYLYTWTRVFIDTLLLLSDLSRVSAFTKLYTEDLDLTIFLRYVSSTIRTLDEVLDIVSYIDVMLNWYRIIVIESLDIFLDFTYTMSWVQGYLEQVGIAHYIYKTVNVPIIESLNHLDYLLTVTSYLREFIENLSLQDIFSYGWIYLSMAFYELMNLEDGEDPIHYLLTVVNYRRTIYQITDISSYLQNITFYPRLAIESLALLDIHPIFGVIKIITLPLSLVDRIIFSMQKPFLTQLQYLGFQTLRYNMGVLDTLQLIEEYDTIWQSYLYFVETLDITDLLIRSVVSLYSTTDLYLKKITADLTARFSRLIRA